MDFVDNFSVDKPHINNIYVNFSAMTSAEKFRQSAEIYMCAGHGTILAGESPVMGNLPLM